MAYRIFINKGMMRFSYDLESGYGVKNHSKNYYVKEKNSIEKAKDRCRKARRRLMSFLLSLKSDPTYFATFTIDTDDHPEMRARHGIVSDDAWSKLQDYKRSLNKDFAREFPKGWAVWVVEVGGNTDCLHIHYYLRTNDKSSLGQVFAWAEEAWEKITQCTNEDCVDVEAVWEANGIKQYAFNGKKVAYQYPMHPHARDAKTMRRTWGKVNKKNMKFHKEDSGIIVEDDVMREIIQAIIKDYKNYCAEKGIPVNKRHLRRLRESNGYNHIFNNKRQWKIMVRILTAHGINLEQAPRKAGKKRK